LPPLFFAALYTVGRFKRSVRGSDLRPWSGALLFALNLAGFLLASPLPGGGAYRADRFTDGGRGPGVRAVLALVPPSAPVSAQSNLVAHLSEREGIWEFPRLEEAEYVLLDARGPRSTQSLAAG